MNLEGRDTFVVGYLSGGHTTTEFTSSLAAAVNYAAQLALLDESAPLQLGTLPLKSGPRIAHARNKMVHRFLELMDGAADWLIMVDDDMEFPVDAFHRLLAYADPVDRPIVGGLAIAGGRDGWFPTMFRLGGTAEEPFMERTDGWPTEELVEVDATGAACLLVHRSVFEKIATEYEPPWIWFQETKMGQKDVGEDVTFCLRARSLGFPIHVATQVQFGHLKMVNIDADYYARWVESHRFIITGTGRCGTGYLAHVLAASGIPCGHEQTYRPAGDPEWGWRRGDSSWLAAPHLAGFSGHVVHLVRHPLAVIGSLLGIGFFNDERNDTHGPWIEYADEVLTDLEDAGVNVWTSEIVDLDESQYEVAQCMVFVETWNRLIEPYADQGIRVEDVTPEDLVTIARAAGANHSESDFYAALQSVPTDVNHRQHTDITWDDLPDGTLKDELKAQAVRYGYDTDTTTS